MSQDNQGVTPSGSGSQASPAAPSGSAPSVSIPNAALDELRSAAAELARRAEIDTCGDWPEGVDGSYLDRVRAAIDATYPVIWTDEQVAKLNEYQAGYGHPFTCGSGNRMDAMHRFMRGEEQEDDFGQLIATPQGWMCPACDYRQFWAHDFMFNGAMPIPFASGIEARSDETPQAAQPAGQEPGPQGDAQPQAPHSSHPGQEENEGETSNG